MCGGVVEVNQVVDSGCSNDDSNGEEADEGNTVGVRAVRGDNNEDSKDDEEHPHDREPCVVRELSLNICDNLRDQDNDPSELLSVSV